MDYTEAFRCLNTNNKFCRKSPHKAVLLLTIIEMFESNIISKNIIKYDDVLKNNFLKVWNIVLPNEATFLPEVYLPFWYMQSEKFWHIVPLRGKEDVLLQLRDNHVKPSESKIHNYINYAELDEDLYFLMTISSGRSSLKSALLETYFNLSDDAIAKLCTPVDNIIDYSVSALDSFNGMIQSSKEQCSSRIISLGKDFSYIQNFSEDIQLIVCIEYYSFLKRQKVNRSTILDVIPNVNELVQKLYAGKISENLSSSLSFLIKEFLSNLKVALMTENDSYEFVDTISRAIHQLETIDEKCSVEDGNELNITSNLSFENISTNMISDNDVATIKLFHGQGDDDETIAETLGFSKEQISGVIATLPSLINNNSKEPHNNLDYYVVNTSDKCSIFSNSGKCEFSTTGLLKIFHCVPYRFNYKSKYFTIKSVDRKGAIWIKGSKKLVAYCDSDLYKALNSDRFLEQIEDFLIGSRFEDSKIRVNGSWYNYAGKYIRVASEPLGNTMLAAIEDDEHDYQKVNFIPRGKLKNIDDVAESSYDYLWLMSIVDFAADSDCISSVTFDELACRIISNAWDILNKNEDIKVKDNNMTECIEYLISESKDNMDSVLNWGSSKEEVFTSIKNYPMSGLFEDTVDSIMESVPFNILRLWIVEENEIDFVMLSINYHNSCLYGLHLRKIDPYIDINPKWKNYLSVNHDDLIEYYTQKYIQYQQH